MKSVTGDTLSCFLPYGGWGDEDIKGELDSLNFLKGCLMTTNDTITFGKAPDRVIRVAGYDEDGGMQVKCLGLVASIVKEEEVQSIDCLCLSTLSIWLSRPAEWEQIWSFT